MNTKKQIQITCTGEQVVYHDYYKPFICIPDIEMPKMYNQGYNSFRFVGGEPEFTGKNMPEVLKRETNNYLFYECQIEVHNKDKRKTIGSYYKTVDKTNGEIKETFCFD